MDVIAIETEFVTIVGTLSQDAEVRKLAEFGSAALSLND